MAASRSMKLDGPERLRIGGIPPHGRQVDRDASVGAEAQAILGDRRVEEMAAELFEASAIVRSAQTLALRVRPRPAAAPDASVTSETSVTLPPCAYAKAQLDGFVVGDAVLTRR
jgi:hypothetical protein